MYQIVTFFVGNKKI